MDGEESDDAAEGDAAEGDAAEGEAAEGETAEGETEGKDVGTLKVTVAHASGLLPADKNGLSDPFVKARPAPLLCAQPTV